MWICIYLFVYYQEGGRPPQGTHLVLSATPLLFCHLPPNRLALCPPPHSSCLPSCPFVELAVCCLLCCLCCWRLCHCCARANALIALVSLPLMCFCWQSKMPAQQWQWHQCNEGAGMGSTMAKMPATEATWQSKMLLLRQCLALVSLLSLRWHLWLLCCLCCWCFCHCCTCANALVALAFLPLLSWHLWLPKKAQWWQQH